MKKGARQLILNLLFFLPKQRNIAVDRWLRGRQEFQKLTQTDCVVVSHGKSGRTWLRVMLSRFYQQQHGLLEPRMLEFDNLHHQNPRIPKIFFTHDNVLTDYTKSGETKTYLYDKRVLLLIRHPADVTVSQFFQWKHRMSQRKIELNHLPDRAQEIPIFEFVTSQLPRTIAFLNTWAKEIPRMKNILVVRYEDMRLHAEQVLARSLEFMGTPGPEEQIKEAVAFASYDNMRKLEETGVFGGKKLTPSDKDNPDSYKVRRAKVGGYRDYFNDHEQAVLDEIMRSGLSPHYREMEEKARALLTNPG